jgi:uncharacterized membrane protein YcaP (DUF421 family)
MSELFGLSLPWWHFVARGALAYLLLLALMRLTGKRSLGEMAAFDVIVLVLVGGTLRTAIIGEDHSLLGPFIGVATILAVNKLLGWLATRSPRFNRLLEGYPIFLVRDGRLVDGGLRRADLPRAALDRALRSQGHAHLDTVREARLEPNGKVSVVARPRPRR